MFESPNITTSNPSLEIPMPSDTKQPKAPLTESEKPSLDKGVKFDKDKLPVHLLPFDALMAITEIMQYGAKKYTRKFENEWEGFWTLVKPVAINLVTPKGSVVTVTKNNSETVILSSQNDKEKIPENGMRKILSEKMKLTEIAAKIDTLTQTYAPETSEQSSSISLQKGVSPKTFTKMKSLEDALSAAPKNTFTLITTIQREGIEEYYAVNTTTVLDSLEITLRGLKPLLNILKAATLHELTGARNWERGMNWSQLFRACNSHLWKWWMNIDDGKGPGMDEDTGKSHLLHAGCCLLFLIAYELRKVGEDDRP